MWPAISAGTSRNTDTCRYCYLYLVVEADGIVVLCKKPGCKNPVAKQGRICDPCYLKMPGGRKPCPTCKAIIHIKQKKCAQHMLDAKSGRTRRLRPPIPKSVQRAAYQRDSYTCVQCGLQGRGETHEEKVKGFAIDHVIPNAAGGSSELENLQILCRKCNSSKWF
jgi:5-methylcytosine-specific restriction endonuclease McrA